MILQLLETRPELTLMSHAHLNERQKRQIDATFSLPYKLDDILKQPSFWESLSTLSEILNPILKAMGYLAFDAAKMADVYA